MNTHPPICNDTNTPLSDAAERALRTQLARVTAERDALAASLQLMTSGTEALAAVSVLLGKLAAA